MQQWRVMIALLLLLLITGCRSSAPERGVEPENRGHQNVLIDLWEDGKPAFGIYVPDEDPLPREERRSGRRKPPTYTRDGGARLARNPLYDFLFLNLEGNYDPAAVEAIAQGIRNPDAARRKTLLVRIPPISRDGEEETRRRVNEILAQGADGVVLPHIRNLEEARTAVGFFREAGADVWSPQNPEGEVLAMLMLEDPEAVAQAPAIADLPGISILACGIGSLTQALEGDRDAAEAGNQRVLAETKLAGLADMITADQDDIEQRIQEGFLALLMQGPTAEETIRIGRRVSGR